MRHRYDSLVERLPIVASYAHAKLDAPLASTDAPFIGLSQRKTQLNLPSTLRRASPSVSVDARGASSLQNGDWF